MKIDVGENLSQETIEIILLCTALIQSIDEISNLVFIAFGKRDTLLLRVWNERAANWKYHIEGYVEACLEVISLYTHSASLIESKNATCSKSRLHYFIGAQNLWVCTEFLKSCILNKFLIKIHFDAPTHMSKSCH